MRKSCALILACAFALVACATNSSSDADASVSDASSALGDASLVSMDAATAGADAGDASWSWQQPDANADAVSSTADAAPDAAPVEHCGGLHGTECSSSADFCYYSGEGGTCGAGDALGECRPRPSVCSAPSSPVCGCDGNNYVNACEAAMAGTSVASVGRCGISLATSCAPMEAVQIGNCRSLLGYAWTGGACRAVGCSCIGDDCDNLYVSSDDCEAAYIECAADVQACTDDAGCAIGEHCYFDYTAPVCGGHGNTGYCALPPSRCPTDCTSQVCGCNDTTYCNICDARMHGTSVQVWDICE